jgi:hypothetical protein
MLVACDQRVIVPAGEGGDPDVVFQYGVTAAFQVLAYLRI